MCFLQCAHPNCSNFKGKSLFRACVLTVIFPSVVRKIYIKRGNEARDAGQKATKEEVSDVWT